jgi:hypothetical protein
VDAVSDPCQCVGNALGRRLSHKLDRNAQPFTVAKAILDLLTQVPDHHHHPLCATLSEHLDVPFNKWPVSDREHRFGQVLR